MRRIKREFTRCHWASNYQIRRMFLMKGARLGIVVILLATLAMVLGGCAASSSVKNDMKSTVPLSTFSSLEVKVNADTPIADCDKEKEALRGMIIAKLQTAGKWSIAKNGQAEIDATIVEIKRVSAAARVMLGAMAGQASTSVNVIVKEKTTGNIINKFSVEGKSSGGTVFAGGTDQSVEKAAEQITAELVK